MLLPAIQTLQEWGAMFTDVAQWTAAVDEICRRERIRYRQIEAGYPGSHAVFCLDRSYVVKIYAPFFPEDFDLERTLYPVVSRHTNIPSPRLVAQGILEDAIRWPYIVMDFKPGQPIREVRDRIAPDNLIEIAATLGDMIRKIHDIPLTQLDGLGDLIEDWETFARDRKARCVEDLCANNLLPPSVIDAIPAFLAAHAETTSQPLRLVNGDLTEDHILLEQRHGSWCISGLIDFGDAMIAPREYEWIALWFSALDCQGDEFRACMQSYGTDIALDGPFFDAAMAFTLLHEFAAGIIDWTLKRWEYPPVQSFRALQDLLWRSRLS
ncbi:MAG: aminoglycoside phosphotransferase family protein [Anaerolineae bacterium]|nr:aminoglycoside phosphotransferase family protein [Anaerolineae bacterium]